MKTFPTLSLIQKSLLFDVILTDPDTLEWTDDTYTLKAFYVDKKGWMYKMRFTFNNGWLFVEAEHRMGGYDKYTWNQEGRGLSVEINKK